MQKERRSAIHQLEVHTFFYIHLGSGYSISVGDTRTRPRLLCGRVNPSVFPWGPRLQWHAREGLLCSTEPGTCRNIHLENASTREGRDRLLCLYILANPGRSFIRTSNENSPRNAVNLTLLGTLRAIRQILSA